MISIIQLFRSCLKTSRSRREAEETRSLRRVNEEFLTTSNAEIGVFRQLLVGLIFFNMSALSYGGSASSGGGYLRSDQSNIWYMGEEPVSYRIRVSDGYGITQEEARSLVKEAIQTWQSFFEKYGFKSLALGSGHPKFGDGLLRKMSFNFRENEALERAAEEELEFFFGVENELVSSYRKIAPQAAGAAIRKPYNTKTFRTGGVVWIKELGKPVSIKKLRHLLLHELGHVFGLQHDSVFVMDEEVAEYLYSKNPMSTDHLLEQYLGVVESPRWLYRWRVKDIIDFTFDGCLKFKNGRSPSSCSGIPEDSIPEEAKSIFEINRGSLVEIKLKIETLRGVGQRGFDAVLNVAQKSLGGRSYKARFEEDQEQHQLYSSWNIFSNRSPGLFLEWSKDPKNFFVEQFFFWPVDHSPFSIPASGYIEIDGARYAAVIEAKGDPKLKIFLPKLGTWWVI